MNFSELRDLTLERMGEYTNQAVAAEGDSAYGNALVLRRLLQVYRRLHMRARERGPERFSIIGNITYPADTEYIDLGNSGYLTGALKHAEILGVYEIQGSNIRALAPIAELQYEHYKAFDEVPEGFGSDWLYYVDGFNFFVLPKPAAALTLRFRYIPDLTLATTTSTWTADSPGDFPVRFHELIALEAALSFLNERGSTPATLQRERDELLTDFIRWASDDRRPGTRTVIEV